MDAARLVIGLIARGITYLGLVFIVGNAVVESAKNGDWVLALIELAAFPLTFLIYPFAAPEGAQAWPLADGTSFIPALIAALVAYPISTFIGGLDPID